jgi:CubicO group peptidase (beta-lactamase class C family)
MRVKLLGVTGIALALVLASAAPARQGGFQSATVSAQPEVPALVRGYVASGKIPGLVIALGHGDAPPEFYAGGKIASEPGAAAAGPDSLWRIYSMTKPVTGIAAMILIDDGKLGLDQPISDFIPAFRNMKVLDDPAGTTLASHPAKTSITVRHLLTHTAGLGYTVVTKGPLLDEYNRLGINPAAFNAATEVGFRNARAPSLEVFAERVATLPLIAEPGTRWSYSIGLDLLGRVIEVASGMPFDAFLQKRLFDPLKMKSTFFTVPAPEVGRFATNYFYFGDTPTPVDPAASSVWLKPPSFPYGGAGLVSSARDYDRFLHMLLNQGTLDGVRILKAETARLAMSNLLPPGADTRSLTAMGLTSGMLGFGAGGSVYLADATSGPRKGTYGWGGAAGTIGWVDPARRLRGTVMVNYMPSEKWPLRQDLNKALYGPRTP